MKHLLLSIKFACTIILCGALMLTCRKPETNPGDGEPSDPPANTTNAVNADTISNHLRFFNAVKKQGTIPKGPVASSLKISFKDTLYLAGELKQPFKFLHEDTTKNVAGVYIQVHGSAGGTFYYDVPEVPDIATSDTVSVILIGIDPKGLIDPSGVPPAGAPFNFEITIVPHDKDGEPLGEATRPVQISTPIENPLGTCGLITKPGDYWDWEISYVADPNSSIGETSFLNSPDKLWGLTGQNIQGCCANGVSAYTANCAVENQRSLNFQTFFGWPDEVYKFIENGTYAGQSDYFSAIPDPQGSDFCSTGDGVVHEKLNRNFLEGNWTITTLANPVNGDSLYLTAQGTTAIGAAASPTGIIRALNCFLLVLIEPDHEGGNAELVKFYYRKSPDSPYWNPFD
jgi:hypothetical protein